MEALFRGLKEAWRRRNAKRTGVYYGIVIDEPADPLTNLRFADDVLLDPAVEEAASVDAAQSRAERPRSPPVAIISLISSDSEASVDYP